MRFQTMADVRAVYPKQFDTDYLREMGIKPGRTLYGGQFFIQRGTGIYDEDDPHQKEVDPKTTFLFQNPMKPCIELVECYHRYNIIEVTEKSLLYMGWERTFFRADAADRYVRRHLLPPPPPPTRFERDFKI